MNYTSHPSLIISLLLCLEPAAFGSKGFSLRLLLRVFLLSFSYSQLSKVHSPFLCQIWVKMLLVGAKPQQSLLSCHSSSWWGAQLESSPIPTLQQKQDVELPYQKIWAVFPSLVSLDGTLIPCRLDKRLLLSSKAWSCPHRDSVPRKNPRAPCSSRALKGRTWICSCPAVYLPSVL